MVRKNELNIRANITLQFDLVQQIVISVKGNLLNLAELTNPKLSDQEQLDFGVIEVNDRRTFDLVVRNPSNKEMVFSFFTGPDQAEIKKIIDLQLRKSQRMSIQHDNSQSCDDEHFRRYEHSENQESWAEYNDIMKHPTHPFQDALPTTSYSFMNTRISSLMHKSFALDQAFFQDKAFKSLTRIEAVE